MAKEQKSEATTGGGMETRRLGMATQRTERLQCQQRQDGERIERSATAQQDGERNAKEMQNIERPESSAVKRHGLEPQERNAWDERRAEGQRLRCDEQRLHINAHKTVIWSYRGK